mgnify:CR=1 FL=1
MCIIKRRQGEIRIKKTFFRIFIKSFSIAMVVFCMGVIFNFSSQHSVESSELSGGITNKVISVAFPNYKNWSGTAQRDVYKVIEKIVRKSAHFSIYCLLGFLSMFAAYCFFSKRVLQLGTSLLVSVAYAASDEMHQLFVPGRSAEFGDVLIDSLGALLGIIIMWMILAIARNLYQRITKTGLYAERT